MYVSTYMVSGSIGEMRKPNDNAVQYEVLVKGCALVDENVCSLVMLGEKANQNQQASSAISLQLPTSSHKQAVNR